MYTFNLLSSNTTTPNYIWRGGEGTIFVEGTFTSGTLTFQALCNSGTFLTVGTDTTFTSPGMANFALPRGTTVRASLASAAGGISCLVSIGRVKYGPS